MQSCILKTLRDLFRLLKIYRRVKKVNHKAERISRYHFTSQHKLFLDANIWLYLYGPKEHSSYWVEVYSEAFNRILKAESDVYIDVLIVSEFINRFARDEWELSKLYPESFKIFRNSLEFEAIAQGIAAAVKRIMRYCIQIESGFRSLKIENLLDDFANGKYDFNDQVITEFCKNNGLTLVTHDGDFDPGKLHILTENNYILNKR